MNAQVVPVTAEALLAQARDAWRTRNCAMATLARLRSYGAQTAGMKYDAAKAVERLNKANDTLRRILGSAA